MPPLRRVVVSSSELSSSYLLFVTLVLVFVERIVSHSSCETVSKEADQQM